MSEVNLPNGWLNTTLESLTTDISYGYTASSTEKNIGPKMLRITDIQDNHVDWKSVPFCEIDDSKVDKYLLRINDLVFARTGATVGKSYLIRSEPPPAVYASYLIRVRTASDECISMLAHFFNSSQYWQQITEFSAGIGQPNVNGTKLKNLIVPLLPLAEQKVIADQLDTLLAQVETTKARLERIPEILKSFRQSVFSAAVTGKLTEEWRDSADLSEWKTTKLGEIVKQIEAGKNLQCIEVPPMGDEHGIIKISAVTWGVYDEEQSKTLPDKSQFVESRRIAIGDFLISRANTIELLGNPVIVHKVTKNLMLSDKVLRLVMPENDKPWVSIFLRSKRGRFEIESRSTGNQMSMRNIGQKALLDIDLPKPPASEQHEIVRRVEQLFAFADSIEQKANAALSRVNNLTQSILAKTFRGELTADWRAANSHLITGDNSAEALLDKIKAERAKLTKKTKAKA